MSLVAARPDLGAALEHDSGGGLGDIERHFTAYLDAEQKLGRISRGVDTEALAFTLLGTAHHLILSRRDDTPGLRRQMKRIVAALFAGMNAGAGSPGE